MNNKNAFSIPEPIAQLQQRFDVFRSTQPHRTKLPGAPWQAAVELAREHGLHPVVHPLRLDYMELKRRLEGLPSAQKKAAVPAFVDMQFVCRTGVVLKSSFSFIPIHPGGAPD